MQKLTISDLISIAIYSTIYFILVAVAALICVFLIPGYSYIFIPAITALISGTVFMLCVAKVQKFGAITIMGSIMGIFFFISGRFPFALIPAVGFSLLADAVNLPSHYRSKPMLVISYLIFSLANCGPIIPLYLNTKSYTQELLNQGRDLSYVQSVFNHLLVDSPGIMVLVILISALIGGIFGQKMISKHFEQSGII
ncbi:MptD family putative ECF transporter S component [Hutsoniella sourekii]|uniref:MptD family putative ECF transporter S component n=1 Tax=Hutsoniella sourekii TaxID=87650 RepID=UPI00047F4058|nr:MptD family putative ECF transporter S component [Hutsoniella sourekii]